MTKETRPLERYYFHLINGKLPLETYNIPYNIPEQILFSLKSAIFRHFSFELLKTPRNFVYCFTKQMYYVLLEKCKEARFVNPFS